MSLHRTVLGRVATGGAIIFALLVVQLFLYSPWHRDPAQGRQYCNFFPVEHSNAVAAAGQVIIPPPRVQSHLASHPQPTVVASCYQRQRASRAPPA